MRIAGESTRYEILPISPGAPPERNSSASAASAEAAGHPASGPAFASLLHALGRSIDAGEALMARAGRGGLSGLDSGQLIALQVGIYRYSEAVDLAAKVVDRVTSGVRTLVSPPH